MDSALLWNNLYASTLKVLGFNINPFYRCLSKQIIYGEKCTLVWYVNDNKMSHIDTTLFTRILNILKRNFGYLVVSRGSKK